MCNLSKGIEEIGLREGKKEGILFSIQSLMETMNFTMEEAMNALKIPKTEQEQYTKKLKQKQISIKNSLQNYNKKVMPNEIPVIIRLILIFS